MSTDTTPTTLSSRAAADRAGTSTEYLRKMIRDGEIAATYTDGPGRPLAVDVDSLDAWIESRRSAETAVSGSVATRAAHRIATAAPRLTDAQKRDLRHILSSVLDDGRTPYTRPASADRSFVTEGEVAA